ncbi:uncharacterized protein B0I36DRAFT_357646 [Microdochium trichocladiopsis]|uniref:Rhodopsin domain-containing protein n=1 Tax=Microdochium trichocladiopsis TaxID=1682393 RepID=A0A9P9BVJ2_9PEZI|nr:uncharacterized protein B0I36DRAFT_357646 [Microdochium trichocladiopsis]KAH7040333.1 hypothetical protein B0I36DRAFT_357646 [Microdochium trichocladiopsis]
MDPAKNATSQQTTEAFIPLDADSHGAVLASVAVISALITASAIIGKLMYRWNIKVLREWDYALLLAVLLVFVQSAVAVYAANLGLGRQRPTVDEDSLVAISKAQYALTILAILISLCTKMCMCLFIRAINSYSHVRYANRVLMGAIGTLCVSSVFAAAFRCPLPAPWWAVSPGSCPAAISIHQFVHMSNMVTDFSIVILALVMVLRVQTGVGAKVLVTSLFAIRMLCPLTAVPIILDYEYLYNGDDNDFTWTAMAPTIWLLVTSHISIITACIPSLKGIFDSWLGNTFGIDIDAPYQLERVEGKDGFEVSDWRTKDPSATGQSSGSRPKTSKNSKNSKNSKFTDTTKTATLKLTTSFPNEAACFSENDTGSSARAARHRHSGYRESRNHTSLPISKNKDDQSESVKGLTEDGFIMIHSDVEVRYDDDSHRDVTTPSSLSPCSSQGTHGGHHHDLLQHHPHNLHS